MADAHDRDMARKLILLLGVLALLAVSTAHAQRRPTARARFALRQLRQTLDETTHDGRFGHLRAYAVKSTALNAIALSDRPRSVLDLVQPRLKVVRSQLPYYDGIRYSRFEVDRLTARLHAAVRVRELALQTGYGDALTRELLHSTEDGTLGFFGAYRIQAAALEAIGRSRNPRAILERVHLHLEPVKLSLPWYGQGLVSGLLTNLDSAARLLELDLGPAAR
jgi:hypothetical protein